MTLRMRSAYRFLLAAGAWAGFAAANAQADVAASHVDMVAPEQNASDARTIALDPDIEPPVFTPPQAETESRTSDRPLRGFFRWLREREPSLEQLSPSLMSRNAVRDDETTSEADGIAGLDATTTDATLFDTGPDVGFDLGPQTGLTVGAGVEGTRSPNDYLDSPVLDTERYRLSIGVTHRTSYDWTVKAAYQYGWLMDSSISRDRSLSDQDSLSSSSSSESTDTDEARIEPDAHTVAIGIARRF